MIITTNLSAGPGEAQSAPVPMSPVQTAMSWFHAINSNNATAARANGSRLEPEIVQPQRVAFAHRPCGVDGLRVSQTAAGDVLEPPAQRCIRW